MKQKRIDAEVKRVSVHYQWWKKYLGLEDWHIKVVYFDTSWKRPGKGRTKTHGVIADATVDWEYKKATIRINLKETRMLDERALEAVIVHELMHVHLNEMRNYSADDGIYHEERVATQMAAAYIWTRYADRDAA